MKWELRSHVTCRGINIMYYLKCNMCHHKETYIGKTNRENVVGLKSRINQHTSFCWTGTSTGKFPIHVYHWAMKNKCLKESYFQLNIMVKLKTSREFRKTLKYVKLSLFSNGTNLFFAIEKFHSEKQMQNTLEWKIDLISLFPVCNSYSHICCNKIYILIYICRLNIK